MSEILDDRNMIIFDGECVLCSGFFKFMLATDKRQIFSYAVGQSPVGQAQYAVNGLPTDHFDTILVIREGVTYQRLDACAMALGAVGLPWCAFAIMRFLPMWLKDWGYGLVARNRFRLLGRRDSCLVPGPELRARFVEDGF